jgi:hypothetical protein
MGMVVKTEAVGRAHTSAGEVADELSGWNTGGGMVTMALFPLALPILGLTVVATIPLVLIGLAVGVAAALVALPVLVLWRLGRLATRALLDIRPAINPRKEPG